MSAAFALLASVFLAGAAWAGDGGVAESHMRKGLSCTSCHGEVKQYAPVQKAQCVACHDTKTLAAKTAKVAPTNPHENRHYGTEADCNLCHRAHQPSVNFCADCHARFNFKVK